MHSLRDSPSGGRIQDLATVALHDATLATLTIDWASRSLAAVVIGVHEKGDPTTVRWNGVTSLEVTRFEPWGPSVSILEARGGPTGPFEIQMQSGDLIRVQALECLIEFVSNA